MEENKEIIDKKNTIKQKINIDQQNNANINDTISFMSYHIDGDKTKEYLDFMKKVRKLRKKINKNKEKLYEYDKIEKAYLEKDSRIRNIFKNFAAKYKDRYNNYETVTAKEKNQCELEYWKSCLKQIEIENIKEFE